KRRAGAQSPIVAAFRGFWLRTKLMLLTWVACFRRPPHFPARWPGHDGGRRKHGPPRRHCFFPKSYPPPRGGGGRRKPPDCCALHEKRPSQGRASKTMRKTGNQE